MNSCQRPSGRNTTLDGSGDSDAVAVVARGLKLAEVVRVSLRLRAASAGPSTALEEASPGLPIGSPFQI